MKLVNQVRKIKREWEGRGMWIKGNCVLFATQIAAGSELLRARGYYIGPGCPGPIIHNWNYDPKEKRFYDATAQQFDSSLPEVLVVPVTQAEEYYKNWVICEKE